MRGYLLAMCVAAAAVWTAPALRAQPAAAPAAKADRNDPDEIICRRSSTLGSRIPGPRTCLTRRKWEDMRLEAGKALSEQQTRGLQSGFVHP